MRFERFNLFCFWIFERVERKEKKVMYVKCSVDCLWLDYEGLVGEDFIRGHTRRTFDVVKKI